MNKKNEQLFNEMLEVATNRRTAKQYDMNLDVDQETLDKIYEFALKAPSSMGMEFSRIISINRTSEHKKGVNEHLTGFNQERAFMASNLSIIITKTKEFFTEDNPLIVERAIRLAKLGANARGVEYEEGSHLGIVNAVLHSDHANNGVNQEEWQARQAYIILSYLLLGASTLGVETTTMEGFTSELTTYLRANGLISNLERATLIVTMGYVDEANKMTFVGDKQERIELDEFVKTFN